MSRLHVSCTRPGMIRGGVRHPRHAEYPIGHFDEAALRDMLGEPEIRLVVGVAVTADMLPMLATPPAEAQPDAASPPIPPPSESREAAGEAVQPAEANPAAKRSRGKGR